MLELENVIYEVKENVAKITMNRGDKMNALNHGLWDDLLAAFEEAEMDPEVRAIILCGSGKAFCSGWDLKESYYITGPKGQERWTTSNALSTLRRMRTLSSNHERSQTGHCPSSRVLPRGGMLPGNAV